MTIMADVLSKFDCDARTNVYIAVTGILVAIVIFVVEIMSDHKNELYKKIILKNTEIVESVLIMMDILVLIWISHSIDSRITFLYVLSQSAINILIAYSVYKTIKMFHIAIKLNLEDEYFNEKIDDYITKELSKISKIDDKIKKKNSKKIKMFEKFISGSKLYKKNLSMIDITQEYKKLYSDTNFYIGNYNYNILKKIEKYSNVMVSYDAQITENNIKTPSEIILCKNIGEKVNKRVPLAYYKNVDEQQIKRLKQSFIADTNKKYATQNIINIIDGLFKFAKLNKRNYDETNQLLNFYDFLCKKNYDEIRQMFMNSLEFEIDEIKNNKKYRESYIEFLVRLLIESLKNDNIEDYVAINSKINSLFYLKMKEKHVDLKRVAYEYVNRVFLISFYVIMKEEKMAYYDSLMSNLLVLINELIKLKEIKAVKVCFDNIHFIERPARTVDEFDEYSILNLQFMVGIITSLLYSYDKFSETSFSEIKNLIKQIENKFVAFTDVFDAIMCFKKCQNHKSEINHKIKFFDFNNVEHEYKNSWIASPISEYEVLNCLLYMCKFYYYDDKNLDSYNIDRNDKFYFEGILRVLHSAKYDKLQNVFCMNDTHITKIETVLNAAIAIAEEKEEIHKRECKLEQFKVEEFKRIILEKSKEKTGILAKLNSINKIKFSNQKAKGVYGFNQLIPREIFFKDVGGMESLANSYGTAFVDGINEKISELIVGKSKSVKESLEKRLAKIEKVEDYIILMNFGEFYRNKLVRTDGKMIYKGKELDVIKTEDVDRIIIINKNSLPEIEYCKFTDDYETTNIFDNMYYKFEDCSDNNELVKEIISKTDWIKENRTEDEQINYLRQHCSFQAFISYKITFPKKIESFIVRNN